MAAVGECQVAGFRHSVYPVSIGRSSCTRQLRRFFAQPAGLIFASRTATYAIAARAPVGGFEVFSIMPLTTRLR